MNYHNGGETQGDFDMEHSKHPHLQITDLVVKAENADQVRLV